MAAIYPTHPGPSAGQRHDEFTTDELLEAMAKRQRQQEDIAAFKKKAMATPQEARDLEAQFRGELKGPEPSKLEELKKPAKFNFKARIAQIKGIEEREENEEWAGYLRELREGLINDPEVSTWKEHAQVIQSYEKRGIEWDMGPFGPMRKKPRVYTHDELIKASDGRLTVQSLKKAEAFEKFIENRAWAKDQGHEVGEWPEEDFQKHMRLVRLREYALLKILGRLHPGAPLSARYREFAE